MGRPGLFTLPEGYRKIRTVNLVQDRKAAGMVSLLAIAIGAAVILLGRIHLPLARLLRGSVAGSVLSIVVLIVLLVAYIIGHELVHGLFIRIFSGRRPKYGFNLLYAYAGSEAYFTRAQYIIIALAPVVLFGVLFLVLALLLPPDWFWHVHLLQAYNLAGATGDYYIVALVAKLPGDLLARDTGFEMEFYSHG